MRRCEYLAVTAVNDPLSEPGAPVLARLPYRRSLRALLPDVDTLACGLKAALKTDGCPLTIVERQPQIYASSYPSEIVRCRFADGSERQILCKYATGLDHNTYGHRGGVAYEADVYRHVLEPLRTSTPRFYGSLAEVSSRGAWLLIEYIAEGVRADEAQSPPEALRRAAGWIGHFHSANEARLFSTPLAFLHVHDGDYYRQWARRTADFAGDWHQQLPWLAPLCSRVEMLADAFAALPRTVIHGEFTPHNTLIRGEDVCPIDWESAAIAIGEIDLAGLTDGWPSEVVLDCELEYQRARWPQSASPDFKRTLDMARLYWDLLWLGHQPARPTVRPYVERTRRRFSHLHSIGRRLELI